MNNWLSKPKDTHLLRFAIGEYALSVEDSNAEQMGEGFQEMLVNLLALVGQAGGFLPRHRKNALGEGVAKFVYIPITRV